MIIVAEKFVQFEFIPVINRRCSDCYLLWSSKMDGFKEKLQRTKMSKNEPLYLNMTKKHSVSIENFHVGRNIGKMAANMKKPDNLE
jgi:hypothetical protein